MSVAILVTPIAKKVPKVKGACYVGVDAGSLQIIKQNLPIAFAVGDFDSMGKEDFLNLKKQTECIQHPIQKDETDSELAIRMAFEKGFDSIVLWGALSGRVDHTLANLRLLMYQFHNLVLMDETQKIFYLGPGKHKITNGYRHCSFFVVEDAVVSLSGFLYNLESRAVDRKAIYMVSNCIVNEKADVNVHEGALLCVQSNER